MNLEVLVEWEVHSFDSEVQGKTLTLLLYVMFNHLEPISYQENRADTITEC